MGDSKTLKDLGFNKNEEKGLSPRELTMEKQFILKKELKDLAIKWVKEDKWSLESSFATCDTHIAELFQKRWMKRLDITEGDLK